MIDAQVNHCWICTPCIDVTLALTRRIQVTTFDFTISLHPSDGIRPSGTCGTTQATVTVRTTPAVANQTVTLSAQAVTNSGGHISTATYHADSARPRGSFGASQGTTNSSGVFSTTYTAPIFGGTMRIQASIGTRTKEALLAVFVPDLVELTSGANYVLTGATTPHPANHFGTPGANANLVAIANDYKAHFYGTNPIPQGEKLRYNDQSLIHGGKFEIPGNWCTTCPHVEHRIGINCDVSSINVPQNRWQVLTDIFRLRNSPRFVDETASGNHWHLRFEANMTRCP